MAPRKSKARTTDETRAPSQPVVVAQTPERNVPLSLDANAILPSPSNPGDEAAHGATSPVTERTRGGGIVDRCVLAMGIPRRDRRLPVGTALPHPYGCTCRDEGKRFHDCAGYLAAVSAAWAPSTRGVR